MGLINMRARIYDPYLGRFLSADPVLPNAFDLQSFNRYAYVTNNPLKYTDPSGNMPDDNFGEDIEPQHSSFGHFNSRNPFEGRGQTPLFSSTGPNGQPKINVFALIQLLEANPNHPCATCAVFWQHERLLEEFVSARFQEEIAAIDGEVMEMGMEVAMEMGVDDSITDVVVAVINIVGGGAQIAAGGLLISGGTASGVGAIPGYLAGISLASLGVNNLQEGLETFIGGDGDGLLRDLSQSILGENRGNLFIGLANVAGSLGVLLSNRVIKTTRLIFGKNSSFHGVSLEKTSRVLSSPTKGALIAEGVTSGVSVQDTASRIVSGREK